MKEFEESSQGTVLVAFEDKQEWGDGRDTTFEYAIRLTASLARQCSASDHGIGVLAGPESTFGAHWLDAMDYLATLPVRRAYQTPREYAGLVRPRLAQGSDVVSWLTEAADVAAYDAKSIDPSLAGEAQEKLALLKGSLALRPG